MAQQIKERKKSNISSRSGGQTRSHKTKATLERERQERERELAEFRKKCRTASAVLFAASVLFAFLVLFPGLAPQANRIIFGLFGLSSYIWLAVGFVVSVMLVKENTDEEIKSTIIKILFGAVVAATFIYLLSDVSVQILGKGIPAAMQELYYEGTRMRASGAIGGIVGALMCALFKRTLSLLILVLVTFVLIMLSTGSDIIKLFRSVSKPVKNVSDRAAERMERAVENHRIAVEERRRSRAKFEIDVPIDDEPTYEEMEESRQESEPYKELPAPEPKPSKRGRKSKTAEEKRTPAPVVDVWEPKDEDTSSIDDDEFEQLLLRVACENKPKKQRQAELAKEVIAFAEEIKQQEKLQKEAEASEYIFPSRDLLIAPDTDNETDIRNELRSNADRLVAALKEYGVEAKVDDISRGPAVTRYEIKPAPGVKINRITTLNKDIALRLAAKSVRIEAPIPGKAAVGVEIPNQTLSLVRIRELIESDQFADAKSPVTVAVGKDIEGNIVLADLAKMPHLLIAGATGMGKSVCINTMLMSLIYKSSPQDVRLIMVDPKSVELDVYNGLPHLLVPVVCDPKKAAGALQWAVGEMEKRYALLRERGVRNIDGYNKLAETDPEIQKLPKIVIIIDEMADLMMTAPKEVENTINRLAAMARAAGMHMVLATQRPSVDIITGTIKANIPSRIAFAVSSGIDSKIILDEYGAEELIGKGDMLLHPVGLPKPKRVQGCFVDDSEVDKVVSFIKSHSTPDYDEEIAKEIERNSVKAEDRSSEDGEGFGGEDIFFLKAIDVVTEAGQASTSMLQRKLGVGYARAGRLIDQLEENGIIGPYEGSKPRKVIMSRAQFLEMSAMRNSAVEPQNTAAPVQQVLPNFRESVQNSDEQPLQEVSFAGSYTIGQSYQKANIDDIPQIEQELQEPELVNTVEPHRAPDNNLAGLLDALPTVSVEDDEEDFPPF